MLNLATLCFKTCEDLASVVSVTSLINDPSTCFYLPYGSYKKKLFLSAIKGGGVKAMPLWKKQLLKKLFFSYGNFFFIRPTF